MTAARTPLYSYAQVERMLAGVLGIAPDERAAFEARLRHLRSLGVPRSERPGSGKRISYERSHAAQMLVALLFQSLGCAPRIAAQAAWSAEKEFAAAAWGADLFFVILPQEEIVVARLERIAGLVHGRMACAVLNLTRALKELDIFAADEDARWAPIPRRQPAQRL